MANCTVTGTVLNIDGTAVSNGVITFVPTPTQPVIAGGNAYSGMPVSTTTDINGNITAITLPQGLLIVVTISENGASFGNFVAIVPFASSATFAQLAIGVQPPTALVTITGEQLFIANGTFTTPASVTSLLIEAWGGGGGGGGYVSAATAGGNGGTATVKNAGNTTTYVSAAGGSGGQADTGSVGGGGGPGSGTIGTVLLTGGTGSAGYTNNGTVGGFGGAGPRGNIAGLGTGTFGAGGPGGGPGNASRGGGGGGGGGYAHLVLGTTPGTVYNVVVGTAGAAGTGATANGTAGDIGAVVFRW